MIRVVIDSLPAAIHVLFHLRHEAPHRRLGAVAAATQGGQALERHAHLLQRVPHLLHHQHGALHCLLKPLQRLTKESHVPALCGITQILLHLRRRPTATGRERPTASTRLPGTHAQQQQKIK
ncbi:uncharacterized protein Tco025E_09586 [Trypanosoma conorhini]|uniref:Uncharacterized protein n=1 Tax=Trypanosoma conorhini TaxID=83891 RepID=A0A422MUV2_9TRYP|nr:uncharacterized protein Tco025E_09586 [Trypanosoma conorhini]RNE97012.1 hypothetical protein Tco025E_09586 [Trypanosoma conorhini]